MNIDKSCEFDNLLHSFGDHNTGKDYLEKMLEMVRKKGEGGGGGGKQSNILK